MANCRIMSIWITSLVIKREKKMCIIFCGVACWHCPFVWGSMDDTLAIISVTPPPPTVRVGSLGPVNPSLRCENSLGQEPPKSVLHYVWVPWWVSGNHGQPTDYQSDTSYQFNPTMVTMAPPLATESYPGALAKVNVTAASFNSSRFGLLTTGHIE